MRNFKILILLLLLLNANYSFSQKLYDTFQKINEEENKNSKGYEYLKKLTSEVGCRYTGSDDAKRGEEFVYKLFKSIGLEKVRYQEVDFPADIRIKITFGRYFKSTYRTLQSFKASAFTPVKDKLNISNKIIDVGNGLEEDFIRLRKEIRNRIILVNTNLITSDTSLRNISIREKAELAVKYKADGVIFIDDNQKHSIFSGKFIKGEEFPIPVFDISKKDGDSLRGNIHGMFEYRTVLEINNYKGLVKARNIIGELKGQELPNEYIIIGGHLDSWDVGTGAMDNGLGSMETIDIARTFKYLKLDHKRTIVFVNFMGDEQYLYGSREYMKMLKDSNLLNNVKAFINLDNSGNPAGYLTTDNDLKEKLDSVGDIIKSIIPEYRNNNKVSITTGSAHQPFMLEGVPVIIPDSRLNLKRKDCYHSDCDKIDNIDKQDITNLSRNTTMLLYYLANTNKLPPHAAQSKIKWQMLMLKLKESLIYMGDWRW